MGNNITFKTLCSRAVFLTAESIDTACQCIIILQWIQNNTLKTKILLPRQLDEWN